MISRRSKFSIRIGLQGLALLLAAPATHSAPPPRHPTVESVAAGPPVLMKNALSPETYAELTLEELAHARVLYFNPRWHRRMGVKLPPRGLEDPALVRDILKGYGWATHLPDDPADAFTGKTKKSWADRYGDPAGSAGNDGSARVSSNGEVEVKGNKTPLAQSRNRYHSNGAAKTIEGIDEAISGQLLQQFEHGSNEIVAVLYTGLKAQIRGEADTYDRVLIVRAPDARPAHAVANHYTEPREIDIARVQANQARLPELLPMPRGHKPRDAADAIHRGILELAGREGETLADYYSQQYYFGSVSISNMGIRNKRLDLGDHTSQEGFSKIFRLIDEGLPDDAPFGEGWSYHNALSQLTGSLRETLPDELKGAVPSDEQVFREFDQRYFRSRKLKMVRRIGAPEALVKRLESSPAHQRLADKILEVAESGNTKPVYTEPAGWKPTDDFNFNQIMIKLSDVSDPTVENLFAAISVEMRKNPQLARELAQAYADYSAVLGKAAASEGITGPALRTFMREASRMWNKPMPNLVRGDRRWHELWDISHRAITEGGQVSQQYIERNVRENLRYYPDAAPFEVVLGEDVNEMQGIAVRRLFDAKSGRYESVLRIDVANGQGYFFGRELKPRDLLRSRLSYPGRQTELLWARSARRGDFIEFRMPGETSVDVGRLRLRTPAGELLAPDLALTQMHAYGKKPVEPAPAVKRVGLPVNSPGCPNGRTLLEPLLQAASP
jgi:hypothetical protein